MGTLAGPDSRGKCPQMHSATGLPSTSSCNFVIAKNLGVLSVYLLYGFVLSTCLKVVLGVC